MGFFKIIEREVGKFLGTATTNTNHQQIVDAIVSVTDIGGELKNISRKQLIRKDQTIHINKFDEIIN